MADHQHYEGCYRHHFVCAQERIRDLERQLSHLGNISTHNGNTFTGPLPPPCHDRLPGATWTHPIADEPPVALHTKSYLL